jgi:phage gpG-like protein
MRITVEWQGLDELLERLRRASPDMRHRLNLAVRGASELVATQARANMRSLFKGSGKVAEISVRVTRSGEEVTGEITAGGTPYARIHEYGGTIHLPEIFPVHAQALHWVSKGGDEVFARHAAAHDVVIPERSYLRSAVEQREADIMRVFEHIGDGLDRAA